MACSGCGGEGADMFTPNGDAVCKRCFYADDIKRKESGVAQTMISAGITGIVFGILLMIFGGVIRTGRGLGLGLVLLISGVGSLREGRRRKRLESP